MNANWLRHRHRSADSAVPAEPVPAGPAPAERLDVGRDSAEYQRAHSEARALLAAYLDGIGATVDEKGVSPASPMPSARIALGRRSAA